MIDEQHYDRLVAQIYAAAADTQLLPAVLSDLQCLFGCSAVALIAFSDEPGMSRVTATNPEAVAEYSRNWDARNPLHPLRRRGRVLTAGSVALDDMLLPRAELIRTDYFNGFLLPYDLPHLMAVKLEAGARRDITMNLFRGRRAGFEAEHLVLAHRLAPHLHGAARIADKLAWAGLKANVADTLPDRLGSATVLLDRRGRVLHLNPAAEHILAVPDGLRVATGRLAADIATEDDTLTAMIGRAATGKASERASGAVGVSRPSGRRPWALTIAPILTEVAWLAPLRPAAIVTITDPERTLTPPVDWLAQLYGFTAREAEVALGVAAGGEVKDVAETLGLSVLSARQYLSRALHKSGARRQHDLTRLLVTLGMTPG